MAKNKFESRKDEIRIKTDDPKRMLNKYLVRRVLKSWKEDVIDKDTGEKITLDRSELLFEKGTYVDQNVLSSIKFYLDSGEITEVEVSNQNRLVFPEQNYHMYPYKASVKIGDKKSSYLLYAYSIPHAIIILTDYIELNSKGGFTITDIKELDYCMVLIDNLKSATDRKYELDVAYIKNEISMEEFVNGTIEGINNDNNDAKPEEDPGVKRFYQIKAHVVKRDEREGEEESDQTFIVQTYTAVRANILIEKWLRDKQEELYQEFIRNQKEGTFIKYEINSFIEESKIIPIGCFVPVEFSECYADGENDNR